MNIEMFYYDEHEKMYNEMKMEMEERDKALSSEEREWERQKSSQEARAIMERAERKQKEDCQSLKISEICVSFRTGNTVFKDFRMQY